MAKFTFIVRLILLAALAFPVSAKESSYFCMNLRSHFMHTPEIMKLSASLTEKAKLEGDYTFRISVYVADTLMRQGTIPVTRDESVTFELKFPAARTRTDARCRVELFINGEFLEGSDSSLTLWPPVEPYPEPASEKTVWLFDTSGELQKIFKQRRVKTVDATFQAARDMTEPNIVFIGQHTDVNSFVRISERVRRSRSEPVVIVLRQDSLPYDGYVMIPEEDNVSRKAGCDVNSPLLKGLNKRDINAMVDDARYVKIRKNEEQEHEIDSIVTETIEDDRYVYSYLVVVKRGERVTTYCQLPAADGENPVQGVLLGNLLQHAYNIVENRQKFLESY